MKSLKDIIECRVNTIDNILEEELKNLSKSKRIKYLYKLLKETQNEIESLQVAINSLDSKILDITMDINDEQIDSEYGQEKLNLYFSKMSYLTEQITKFNNTRQFIISNSAKYLN